MELKRRPDADRFLGAPPREVRACLIHGKDRGGVRERADGLAGKIAARPDDPFDVARLGEADLDADGARLADELSAISMMGGRRLVRLRLSVERAALDRSVAAALKAHLEGAYNPEAFFLIEAGALGRDSALRKVADAAKAAMSIPVYDDEVADVSRLLREALARDDVRLTPEALDLLAARLPHERGVARQEVERLVLYLGPGSGVTAGPGDLVDFLGVEPDASLSEAAEDAFGGRLGPALQGLRRAYAEGEDGAAAVGAASRHLSRLRRIDVLSHAGASLAEAVKAAGVFWKAERESTRQARVWAGPELDVAQSEVLATERACKTGGSPDTLLAERLYLSLAGRARRLGL